MKPFWLLLTTLLFLNYVIGQDVNKDGDQTNEIGENNPLDERRYGLNPLVDELDYGQYFREVLKIFETGDHMNKNLIQDISKGALKEGTLNKHLDNLPSEHRSKLDELKRVELQRIRIYAVELHRKKEESEKFHNSLGKHIKSVTSHLDMRNLVKFGIEDLHKLVKEASTGIRELDSLRRQGFKEYEMHKRLELEELKKRLTPEQLAVVDNNYNQILSKHKQLKPVHMPISKAHLLKVWEQRDQMNKGNFNTKTFFHMHDLDGNSFLDEDELKILLATELEEQFNENDTDYDPKEKHEELERMREYAFAHVDGDQDHLISLKEFLDYTENVGTDDSHFWEMLNKANEFTDEEFYKYAMENKDEVNRLIDEGLITLPESGVVHHKKVVSSSNI